MKKHTLLTLSAATLLLFTYGCSLEEYNPSGMSTAQEWTTPEGFEKKVNDCYYDLIRILYGQAEDTYVVVSEGGTDIWQDANSEGTNGNWSNTMRYAGSFSGLMNESYTGFYGAVSACNAAIYYADQVEGLDPDRVNELVAEAHFIRAHALFNIVETYGGKYLPLELPSGESPTSLPCSTANDFYKVILEDLDFAMTYLPLSNAVTGHVTRGAAYHLYAKACLSYASYTDGLGNSIALTADENRHYLEEAKRAADELIDHADTYGVRLYEDVNEVFDEQNNKANAEALFVVCHSSITAYNPRGNYFNRAWKHSEAYYANTAGIYLSGLEASYETMVNGYSVPKLAKGNCYMEPSKYMLDLYVEKDMRYKAFFKDTYYVNKATSTDGTAYTWEAGDAARFGLSTERVGNAAYNITLGDTAVYISRHTYTQDERDRCRYAICNVSDNYIDPARPGRFFPSLKKMDCPSLYAGMNPSKPYSSADCIIYRLGETYLLAAEADWRLGDNDAAAARLNTLRNRSCEGHDGSLDIDPADVTQDFLLDEYAREMIGEWGRWMTLKRFRALEDRIARCNPQITGFNPDVHYLRPIPDGELLLIDNPQEYQNPGY